MEGGCQFHRRLLSSYLDVFVFLVSSSCLCTTFLTETVSTPSPSCAHSGTTSSCCISLNTNIYLRSMLKPPLPIVQTGRQLLPRTTSSYCSPFQFFILSHFTHPGKLWFNFTIVVITVESGTAQLISATTLNSVSYRNQAQ